MVDPRAVLASAADLPDSICEAPVPSNARRHATLESSVVQSCSCSTKLCNNRCYLCWTISLQGTHLDYPATGPATRTLVFLLPIPGTLVFYTQDANFSGADAEANRRGRKYARKV
jgi:hypothetical protein